MSLRCYVFSKPAKGSVAGSDSTAPKDCWTVRGELCAGCDVHAARRACCQTCMLPDVHAARRACCLHKLTAGTARRIRLHSVRRQSGAFKSATQEMQDMHTE